MKEEIYKKNFERYNTVKYKDQTKIFPLNNDDNITGTKFCKKTRDVVEVTMRTNRCCPYFFK